MDVVEETIGNDSTKKQNNSVSLSLRDPVRLDDFTNDRVCILC